MNISKTVSNRINEIEPGKLFRYSDFNVSPAKFAALAATLSRLARRGEIARLRKGQYYKPKTSVFGILKPSKAEIINNLVYENDKLIGYESGLSVYNKLGLTTQVPNEVRIVTNKARLPLKIANVRVRFRRKNMQFKESDIKLLQLLDTLREIKYIPDTNIDESIEIIKNIIRRLTDREIQKLLRLSMKYNPAARALLGAVISDIKLAAVNTYAGVRYRSRLINQLQKLKGSLNPLSKYSIGVSETALSTKEDWRIE